MAVRRWKGFDLDQLARFGVRLDRDCVIVPYYARDGQHYRDRVFGLSGGNWWAGERRPLIPYGLEDLRRGGDALILTEGESDALALRLAFPRVRVLGLPGASSWRSEWAIYTDDFRRVYLSFDADRAGEKLTRAVREDLPDARIVDLPSGADTRDVIQRLGKAAYRVLVEAANRDWETRQAWRALDAAVLRCQRVEEAWRQLQANSKPRQDLELAP